MKFFKLFLTPPEGAGYKYVTLVSGIPLFIHKRAIAFALLCVVLSSLCSFTPYMSWTSFILFFTYMFNLFGGMLIHECGHAYAAYKFKNMFVSGIYLDWMAGGCLIHTFEEVTKKELRLMSAAGPLANIFMGLTMLPFLLFEHSSVALYTIFLQLGLGLSNLIPVKGLDGWNILFPQKH